MLLFSAIIFIFFFLLFCFCLKDDCIIVDFIHHIPNNVLRNHVIRTIRSIYNCELCQIECFVERKCVSYNCRDNSCDLNSSDHILHPDDLVQENGSWYHGAKVSGIHLLRAIIFLVSAAQNDSVVL